MFLTNLYQYICKSILHGQKYYYNVLLLFNLEISQVFLLCYWFALWNLWKHWSYSALPLLLDHTTPLQRSLLRILKLCLLWGPSTLFHHFCSLASNHQCTFTVRKCLEAKYYPECWGYSCFFSFFLWSFLLMSSKSKKVSNVF